ncbi:MAG: ABC transporter permease subunit, partial [Alphaproteobacteria bacterium]|nr:ABC transporter permease subunit [Alphaproteobacteria bacterium]
MDFFDTFLNMAVLRRSLPMLLDGLWLTLQLGAASIIAGLALGLVVALLGLYAVKPVRLLMRLYIDIFRSIPLLVLLIVIYYALPFLGLRLSSFASAMTALTLVSG